MKKFDTQLCARLCQQRSAQKGISLIIVLLILVVVSLLGVGAAQIALMSERGARNDRDQLLAVQSAEAGLVDAAMEIDPNTNASSARKSIFDGKSVVAFPSSTCGTSGNGRGLCAAPPTVTTGTAADNLPEWLRVVFTDVSSNAPSTAFGAFTGQTFEAGGAGVQPARVPRYVIEPITVTAEGGDASDPDVLYRVTVMGFGPRVDIQAVLQMVYKL